ncbi:hypothetical protein [Luteibacter sp. dw_328]|uniref:hypothetical protein n=1 Tax=Luteibacter sp. dw_328 TaxID=2719796 RepID=UPI001BD3A740|nr:hypothetical protein [Luteibacter sp. dw_328]
MSTLIVRSLDLRTCRLVVALLGFLATPAISVGSPALPQMQATAQAAEEAGLHRPPDLEDLWLTVLLKMAPSTPPSSGGYGSTWYVSVSTGGEKPVDLPAAAIARTQIAGITILPASAAPSATASDNAVQGEYHISIGLPQKRPDGNYDVTYGHYCGVMCAGSMTSVVSHDHWGWRIVSSRSNWVS